MTILSVIPEIWKDIEGYEGLYRVSTIGRIMSYDRKVRAKNNHSLVIKSKLLTGGNRSGYRCVELYKRNGEAKQTLIHRIVANTFIENPENKPQVNHKNGIRNDNRLENLEWNTCSENLRHSFTELGRKPTAHWIGRIDENNHTSKKVAQYTLGGIFLKIWPSMTAVTRAGVYKHTSAISQVCKGNASQAGGFIWKYA